MGQQARFARARGAGEAHARCAWLDIQQLVQKLLEALTLILGDRDRTGERRDLTGTEAGDEVGGGRHGSVVDTGAVVGSGRGEASRTLHGILAGSPPGARTLTDPSWSDPPLDPPPPSSDAPRSRRGRA